jgi:hypothetical protein
MQRHCHQEFIRFLNAIEAQVGQKDPARDPGQLRRPQTSKGPSLARPVPAFHLPLHASCSWLNAVEEFFAKLAKRRLKRGVFRCVVDLQVAINRFIVETNDNPKPFTWASDPDKIIAAVRRGHQVLDSIHWETRNS